MIEDHELLKYAHPEWAMSRRFLHDSLRSAFGRAVLSQGDRETLLKIREDRLAESFYHTAWAWRSV